MGEHRLSLESKFIILVAVMASLLEIIDTSIVNVAIPTMMGNLGATLEDISWVVTGYIIANAIVLPLSGWLGMQFGRRKYYITCILFFTAMSVACGLAPNLTVLVIFRILQGLAGGALLPTSQALIQEQFPVEKSGTASAIYGMSVMIGPTLGPTLGGFLTDNYGWRSIFNINLPIGLATALLASVYVSNISNSPAKSQAQAAAQDAAPPLPLKKKIDSIGLGLLALGIGCLQFVLERGQADDWFDSTGICICTVLAALAIPSFILWELKTEDPIVNVRLFKTPSLRIGSILMLELGVALYGLVFIMPVFMSRVLNYDATQTGMSFIPGALLTAFCMPLVGKLLRKNDPRWIILFGVLVLESALFILSGFNSLTGTGDLFWALLVRGLAMAFLFVPINSIVLGQFRGANLGQAAGLLNLFRQLGGSLGIATMSTFFDRLSVENYLNLSSHVTLVDPTTQLTLAQTQAGMAFKMQGALGLTQSMSAALKAIYFRIDAQAFALSFQQLMRTLIVAFGFAVIPLFFLKRVKITGPIDVGH